MPKLLRTLLACLLLCGSPALAQSGEPPAFSEVEQAIFRLTDEAATAHQENDLETVVAKLREVMPLVAERLGKGSSDYADLTFGLAKALDELGKHVEAKPIHVVSVKANSEYYGPDSETAILAMIRQANNLLQLGKLSQAEAMFSGIIALSKPVSGQGGFAHGHAIGGYASLLDKLGRHSEADALHREALQIIERVAGLTHPDTLTRLDNLSVNLAEQGRLEEATAVQLSLVNRQDNMPNLSNDGRITSLANYASLLDRSGKHALAAATHVEVIELARRGNDRLDLAHALNGYSVNQAHLNKIKTAHAAGQEAHGIFRDLLGLDHRDTLLAANSLATLEASFGDPHQAALGFSYIMEQLNKTGLTETNFARAVMGNLSAAMLKHDEHAHLAHRNMQVLANQLVVRRRTLDRSAEIRDSETADDLRRAPIFAMYAETQWARRAYEIREGRADKTNAQDLAFFALQEAMIGSTSRAIASQVAGRYASTNPVAAQLIAQRGELSRDLSKVDAKLSAELTRGDTGEERSEDRDQIGERAQLRSEIGRLKSLLNQTDDRLKEVEPSYFNLLQPEPMGIGYVRQLLREDEAVLLLVPGRYATHVMAVSRNDIEWFRTDWDWRELQAATRRLMWNVGTNVDPSHAEAALWGESNSAAFHRQTAYDLYLQLVAPAKRVLDGKRHVYISAASFLSSVPFSLLVSEEPVGADYDPAALRQTRWLADDYALIQLPSLHSLKFLRDKTQDQNRSSTTAFMGFGDPVLNGRAASRDLGRGVTRSAAGIADIFTEGLQSVEGSVADPEKLRLMARLPGTAEELTALWKAFGEPKNTLFLGQKATEKAVKQASIDTKVLVFATHGLLASESNNIGEPGLVLTPPDQASAADDGFLSSSEIAGLSINADWVILSACNTAAGNGGRGSSGLSGIARAFFFAGARNLLVSHWPVNDDVAAELTVKMMTSLQRDPALSRAEAFQLAMRDIRNDPRADASGNTWAHPAAWAPFTFVGDGASR